MRERNRFRIVLMVVIALALAGCSSGSPVEDEGDPVERELDENLQWWQSKNFTNYSYTFRWNCFCVPEHTAPKRIIVRDGVVDSIFFLDDGRPLDPERYDDYHVIDSLFGFVRDGIERGAYQISAAYDSACGYPASVYIDYKRNLADEENGFTVDDVVRE